MISTAAAKSILKEEGAKKVSKSAADGLKKILEKKAGELARRAIKNASYAGRVTVKAEDIQEI